VALDDLLGALLERSELWFGLMAKLPHELLDRIGRWIEGGLDNERIAFERGRAANR
jgi:hypothetical protein